MALHIKAIDQQQTTTPKPISFTKGPVKLMTKDIENIFSLSHLTEIR